MIENMKKILKIIFLTKSNILTKIIIDTFFTLCSILLFFSNELDEIIAVVLVLFILLGVITGVYRSIYRYSNFFDLIKIFINALIIVLLFGLYNNFYRDLDFVNLLLLFNALIFGSFFPRILIKYFFNLTQSFEVYKTVAIFGAGDAGIVTKRSLFGSIKYKPVFFIDDDPTLLNKKIDGIRVYSSDEKKLKKIIEKHQIDNVVFSTKKISYIRKKRLLNFFLNLKIECLDVPNYENWKGDNFNVNLLRSISLESLMGRDSINVDFSKNYDFYKNKTVLITGAAGSIGSELAISLAKFDLKKMILVDSNETGLFDLQNNKVFKDKKFDLEIFQLNILNNNFFKEIFVDKKINFVFHAAAYKHVPINEATPLLGLYNNIISTYNTLLNSLEFNIEKFILVSTDKAVNPSSVMGASKRICEMMTFLDEFQSDKFSIVTTRFGNVLGSNGSVVNIFKEQILKGGPVEVTHKDITRYFMTIPEAAKLVCEACRIGFNNYLYLFDMGTPIKIDDLARNMVSLNGLTPDVDIEIKYVGLRPGEKLYEELLNNKEETIQSENEHIFIAKKLDVNSLNKKRIRNLISILSENSAPELEVISLIKKIVPDYISLNSKFDKLDKK
jgi:FlaA1/EpsC-like NDP-sugar epimerase